MGGPAAIAACDGLGPRSALTERIMDGFGHDPTAAAPPRMWRYEVTASEGARELSPGVFWLGDCYRTKIGGTWTHSYHAVYVVSGRIGGQTDTIPIQVQKLFDTPGHNGLPAAFALALLGGVALAVGVFDRPGANGSVPAAGASTTHTGAPQVAPSASAEMWAEE